MPQTSSFKPFLVAILPTSLFHWTECVDSSQSLFRRHHASVVPRVSSYGRGEQREVKVDVVRPSHPHLLSPIHYLA